MRNVSPMAQEAGNEASHTQFPALDPIRRLPGVEDVTGLKKSQIYELVGRGEFPAPITLGSKSVGWLTSEIAVWIESRKALRDQAAQTKKPSGMARAALFGWDATAKSGQRNNSTPAPALQKEGAANA